MTTREVSSTTTSLSSTCNNLFQGIVKALREYQLALQDHDVRIFVRRAGPNYQEGLRVMREVGECILSLTDTGSVLSIVANHVTDNIWCER